MQKLKNIFPTKANYEDFRAQQIKAEPSLAGAKVEAQVGFKIFLDNGKATNRKEKDRPPELHVNLIGARHLQDSFGFKKAQGYRVKVKLFPGSTKHESDIQTSSWPKFDQTFKFQLGPAASKSKSKLANDQIVPEKLFKGNFLVFTVFALLELPVTASAFKEGFSNLKRQGSLLLKKRPMLSKYFSTDESSGEKPAEENANEENKAVKPGAPMLTNSESNRNLGSVTYFLDPKIFTKDKNGNYMVDETWVPIKELGVDPKRELSNPAIIAHSSLKGQIEIMLAVCEPAEDMKSEEQNEPSPAEDNGAVKKASFKGLKNLMRMGSKVKDDQCLRVSTMRMRCSIRAKEGFEKITSTMYIKTSVFNQDMPSKSWKSEKFAPALSYRCDSDSTIYVPLFNRDDLKYFNIRISIATKNNVGKKLVLGEVNIGATASGSGYEHWKAIFNDKSGNPITMWHNFQ